MTGKINAVISNRNYLIFHQMQADHFRSFAFLEVALDGFTNVSLEFFHRIRLCEDRIAERPGVAAALGRLFDREDNFSVRHPRNYTVVLAVLYGLISMGVPTATALAIRRSRRR